MQKEIGSNFDLDPKRIPKQNLQLDIGEYGIGGNDKALLSTGRGAEHFVLDAIQERMPDIKRIAMIPPFTCETVIEPFIKKGYQISTYPINKNLEIEINNFRKSLISSGAQVVLIHRYFGFDTLKGLESIILEFSAQGIVFIEDMTQCIFSDHYKLTTDYKIGSLRKWSAIPDGGYATCREGTFNKKPVVFDAELEKEKSKAAYLKYYYLHENKGEKEIFLNRFKKAEDILDAEQRYYKMSPLSEKLQASLDIEELKRKRRNNYRKLYESLNRCGCAHILTPELGDADVPLYLALQCKNRKALQKKLADDGIYAPIVWPQSERMPMICSEAQDIYDTILCLPIDQRYDEYDMERIAFCVKEFFDAED